MCSSLVQKILLFSLFLLASTFVVNEVYADVTIYAVEGSSVPGCEETEIGCYDPKVVTVHVGDTIFFDSRDTASHTFTSGSLSEGPSGIFDTGLGSHGQYTADTVGEIPYYCIVHPWMVGTIIVKGYDNPNDAQYSRTDVEQATVFSETESTIHFGIDREKYYDDGKMSIVGNLDYFVADEKVNLKIISPTQKLVFQKELLPKDKRFFDIIHFENLSLSKSGVYVISADYANENKATINFQFLKKTPEITKTETYYISTIKGKIPIKATMINVERLASEYFNQKAILRFTILADMEIQGTQKITLDIPRNLLDAKDETGKDIPFDVSHRTITGDKIILKTIENSMNDYRTITFDVNYNSSGQQQITIEGTHSLGNRFALQPEPELVGAINRDNLYFSDNNFHLDSDGNITLLANSMWKKFDNKGKLLIESKPELNIDHFSADSNDNLFSISIGRYSDDENILYKFSSDFKELNKFSFHEQNIISSQIIGIDLQDNIHVSGKDDNGNQCFKFSTDLEILNISPICDYVQSRDITDSKGNYYRNYDNGIFCKFSPDGKLLGQFSADGGIGPSRDDMSTSILEWECNSPSNYITRNVILDSNDNVYVTQPYQIGIQKFSPELQLDMILKPEFQDILLAVDEYGFLYVKETGGKIKIYSQSIKPMLDESTEQTTKNSKYEGLSALEIQRQRILEAEANPGGSEIASFVDTSKDPLHYIDRYFSEPEYKKWFDENYPQYSSIYQAVGLEEPVQKNNAAFSKTDYEGHLNEVKKQFEDLEESADMKYQNFLDGKISPMDYITIANESSIVSAH